MGKKGKGKGKSKKKEKASAPKKAVEVDDRFTQMTAEQLQQESMEMTGRLAEVKQKRIYFELERDQVQQLYDIVHNDVVSTEANIRNLNSQMERMQDTHRNNIRMYVQKVKHLEYDHKNTVHQVEMEGQLQQDEETKDHAEKKVELKTEKGTLQEGSAGLPQYMCD
eukprot:27653_1